jgi:CheY-like chemotaxis protein
VSKTVLLVEPDSNTARMVKKYLEEEGILQVFPADSAQEAIHTADEHKPDVVILELAMPRHNGYAFLHEFRSYGDWSKVPVIVHSHLARDEASMSADWERLGAVAYFYKPTTTLKKLKSSVNGALGI